MCVSMYVCTCVCLMYFVLRNIHVYLCIHCSVSLCESAYSSVPASGDTKGSSLQEKVAALTQTQKDLEEELKTREITFHKRKRQIVQDGQTFLTEMKKVLYMEHTQPTQTATVSHHTKKACITGIIPSVCDSILLLGDSVWHHESMNKVRGQICGCIVCLTPAITHTHKWYKIFGLTPALLFIQRCNYVYIYTCTHTLPVLCK